MGPELLKQLYIKFLANTAFNYDPSIVLVGGFWGSKWPRNEVSLRFRWINLKIISSFFNPPFSSPQVKFQDLQKTCQPTSRLASVHPDKSKVLTS
jgi:hypothetical protein